MAADTIGLMDHLKWTKAHVVGASMGGAIAQELAIRHADRLKSITCIMASPGDPTLQPPTAEAIAMLLRPTPLDRDGYVAAYRNTERVLRGPHFPEEEAQDEARAQRNFERGIYANGTTRQLAAIYASGNRTEALGRSRRRPWSSMAMPIRWCRWHTGMRWSGRSAAPRSTSSRTWGTRCRAPSGRASLRLS